MSAPSPDKLLENITKWTGERSKYIVEQFNNPKTHFSVYVKQPEPHKITPVTVAYPKDQEETLQMGWGWRLKEIDRKAYAAIKDESRKERVFGALNTQCINNGLTLIVKPNMDKLEEVQILTSIPIANITGDNFFRTLTNLQILWGYLMYLFERHNMSRAGSSPTDDI